MSLDINQLPTVWYFCSTFKHCLWHEWNVHWTVIRLE